MLQAAISAFDYSFKDNLNNIYKLLSSAISSWLTSVLTRYGVNELAIMLESQSDTLSKAIE